MPNLRRYLLPWALILFFLLVLSLLYRSPLPATTSTPPQPALQSGFRKEIVVASRYDDDTSWLEKELPDWGRSIYIVNDNSAKLTVPINKGREAMVYLTYIINHYDNLPDIMAFPSDADGVPLLQSLQIPYIVSEGYINLRCVWTLGCPNELQFGRENDGERVTELKYPQAFQELFPGTPVPPIVGVACCAQFAATREQIRTKTLEDWKHYRKWLTDTELDDATSGRVLEYAWHIILGKPAVHCPNAAECYCKTYGLCNLVGCTRDACGDRWPFPPWANIPENWPQKGWNGEDQSENYLAELRNTSMAPV
ncbi:MAG: hypothetical protein MMC33_008288 [Icmadophila ericetorum]|nr:hypothetical protein [Icmadophila ericetorum]